MNDRIVILIIDDIEVNRVILKGIFENDYDVIEAENGAQALEILDNGIKVDVILLDIIMPVMDGIDFLKNIKSDKRYCDIPIVVNTQAGELENEYKALVLGADDFIAKPYEPKIVKRRITNIIEKNIYQKKLTYQKIRNKYYIKTGNNIESYTKKQLRIPSLEEYLNICKRYHMKPVIEIKQKMKKDTIKRLYQSLKKAKMQNQAVVTCKYKQQLTYMRKYARKMPLEYVRHDFTQNDLSWMKKYHINVSINKNILSDDMIQLFETNNIKINIWTINNKDQLYNFTNKGIKIVTSDDALWKE